MTIRILAIDDSPTMRGLVAAALAPEGFDLHLAEDGLDGLARLQQADPHLVITDINMPRLDGFGVIDGVRANPAYTSVPILVLTTESGNDLKDREAFRQSTLTAETVKIYAKLIAENSSK